MSLQQNLVYSKPFKGNILLMKMKPKINFLSNILHEHPVFQYLIAIVKKRLTIEDANYLQQQTFAIFDNNQKLFMNI